MRSGAGLLAAAVLALPAAAGGHARSVSYSSVDLDGRRARVVLRVDQLELTRLPFGLAAPPVLPPALGEYAAGALRLRAGGVVCPVNDGPRALEAPPERAVLEWRVECPAEGALLLESDFLLDAAPSHLHFARVRWRGAAAAERVLTAASPSWTLAEPGAAAAPEASSLATYVGLGVEHIATGLDHLVFLLALLLLARRPAEVVTIVTGFTVAHSLTLGLAALGRLHPDRAAIEALIGLSIALVAVENAWLLAGRGRGLPAAVAAGLLAMAALAAAGVGAIPAATCAGLALFAACYFALLTRVDRPARLRVAIAFCFGLVHGFGFAGVLAEVAIDRERLLPALFGFNLGVELGQLAVVAALWPVLRRLADLGAGEWHRSGVEAASGAIAGLGVFWLVARAYG